MPWREYKITLKKNHKKLVGKNLSPQENGLKMVILKHLILDFNIDQNYHS